MIPSSLQKRAIQLAHGSQQGLAKTKVLLCEKIWFPNIDNMDKDTIDKCITCQTIGNANAPEPPTMTPMPKHLWDALNIDFYGPILSGEYLFVLIDGYSRFSDIEMSHSIKAAAAVPKLDRIFVVRKIQTTIKSDKGSPFNGEEYCRYLNALGIKLPLLLHCGHKATV